MTTIVTRIGKGTPLTYIEMDTNLTNLNNDKLEASSLAPYETIANAAATYETIANAAATYETQADATTAYNTLTSSIATKQDSATAVTKDSNTGSANIPAGTTAQRTGSPLAGMFRFNSTTTSFEGYNGTAWGAVGGGATGGTGNSAFYENDTNITVDYTITTGKNAMSAGPITVNNGVTVTVPDGSVWSIV